ncbi:1-(5-phosphoribosyl)-5-[(5-phosphoribosylamino)methylideneamino]imidazole-4-carboxamide isomerase [Candidatus Bathyarchaeota archaeon]|nr:1-(5-phosphoribosyl)-5-[(5-phosphoribosylamino)methylideneamino]imidazole-4-carboxamide isomerase [Candidatus Bathyarchaeota archaeon]
MLIIPSIDISQGKCVKLIGGKPKTGITVSDQPLEVAKYWEAQGAKALHIIDLDGAFSGKPQNLPVITRILNEINLPAEVGGGIRSVKDAAELIEAGAKWVIVGTAILDDKTFLRELLATIGPEHVIIALDSKKGKVLKRGWTVSTEFSPTEIVEGLRNSDVAAFLYTDVGAEGRLSGIRLKTVEKLVHSTQKPIIYSGGVSTIQDIVSLAKIGVRATVIGMALYTGKLSLRDAEEAVSFAYS